MFKKLKEKIGEDGTLERGPSPLRHPPGLAIRSMPPVDTGDSQRGGDTGHTTGYTPSLEIEQEENVSVDSSSKEDEQLTATKKSDTRAQSIMSQLTNELVSLRKQYNQLVADKQKDDKESAETIDSLKAALAQKEEMTRKMERKISDLTWNVDSLNSKLQIYGNYQREEVIQQLQAKVTDLEGRLRQRDFDIEIYETRVAAHSKQRHDDQMAFKKKTHDLQDTVTSLQVSVQEKDTKLSYLNSEVYKIRSSLSDMEKRRKELEDHLDEQKRNLEEKDQKIEDQVMSHSDEIETLKREHSQAISDLQKQLSQVKDELKDKEAKLERLVSQLPHEPLVQTVLDGYSKTDMVASFSTSLRTPGVVYRKEVEPLVRPEHSDSTARESPPAILPLENHIGDGSHVNEAEFNPQYEVQLLELKRYSETLEEELAEKTTTIRLQQQKLNDMKKELMSREHKPSEMAPPPFAPPPPPAPPILPFSLPNDIQQPLSAQSNPEEKNSRFVIESDINFQYLKNVIIRFICTRDDEALQLVKAVATLLELNTAEEKYIRDYLQYKLSWFGTMPVPPQTARTKSIH